MSIELPIADCRLPIEKSVAPGFCQMRNPQSTIRNGFTLIELMLVMALLVIVISVASPSLANFFRGRSLDSEARRLLALAHQGQSRAASEGVPMVLWVDEKKGTYGLEAEPSYEEQDAKAVDFTLDQNLQIQVVNAAIEAVKSTAFGSTTVQNNRNNLPKIRFLPDGSFDETSPKALHLLDRDGTSRWLAQSRNRLNYEIRNQLN